MAAPHKISIEPIYDGCLTYLYAPFVHIFSGGLTLNEKPPFMDIIAHILIANPIKASVIP
jgi:hypothetical protein